MYFFAGGVTIIWGVVVYFVLPPDPIRAKGFGERERFIAVSRMRINNSGVRNTHFKSGQAVELLTDVKFWLIFFYAFLGMIANGPISTFQGIIIKSLGFSGVNSLLIMMPSGAYAGTMMLLVPYLANKFPGWRAYLVAMCQLGVILGSLLLWKLPRSAVGGMLFGVYILPSLGAGYATLMGLFLANNAGYTKRSLASSGLYIGYCFGMVYHPLTLLRMLIICLGNFVGPLVFQEKQAPGYVTGWIVTVIAAIVAAFLVLVYRFVCARENKRRAASGTTEAFDHAYEDDMTDKTVFTPEVCFAFEATNSMFSESSIQIFTVK
jgi:hypothetical protein